MNAPLSLNYLDLDPIDIHYISPENLGGVWHFVKAGLSKIKQKEWLPEDVYLAIKTDPAVRLYVSYGDKGGLTGFVVVRATSDYRGPKLFVWATYCNEGIAVKKYEEDIIRLTRQIGAKRFSFESDRKGWSKLYKPTMTIYECEV